MYYRGTTPHTLNVCWLPAIALQMMEWTEFHVCVTIVILLKEGHSAVNIHMLLRPLKMSECHVYHVTKLFKETGDVCDCPQGGWPCSACTRNVMNVVHTRISQNPRHKDLAPRTISCVLTEDLGLRAYKRYTRNLIYSYFRRIQFERSKKLLHIYSKSLFKKISYKDKKLFTIEQNLISRMIRCMLRHCTKPMQKFPEFKEVSIHRLWWCDGECCKKGLLRFISASDE